MSTTKVTIPKNKVEILDWKRLVVVLENAPIRSVKVGDKYKLASTDSPNTLKEFQKKGKDTTIFRPDILHYTLLTLLDSPLNKAGLLQIYIRTDENILIEVNPQIRLPRTYKRFDGLMVQLLHKLSIHASDGPDKLMKIVKNPVTQYFPPGAKVIGLSYAAEKMVNINKSVAEIVKDDSSAVFVIGCFAHGHINVDYTNVSLSVSNYPLSAACVAGKVCGAFEELWGVL
ncbi:nep1, putative [Entamoeba invadens IP1]|uniref:nep1, putative n=1 Tax=Entamoeba invadens IP1 TaxID=370355 RepID=UPI0002C3F8F2|nr:nep1, putative [Entamoeba invadens IP1]ELP90752.1 nep1, putative [Entamoeba invadens IP1]|eukprot:XP_004257523.1 nep1, putative [Entamoeba invadens IP1]